MTFKAVYVTGAPASGKSSTLRLLQAKAGGIQVWEYGARLTEFAKARGVAVVDQTDVRRRSAGVISPDDVKALDKQLVQWAEVTRHSSHVLIDSHPVTKETYGFRVTAFSSEMVKQLRPDEIWVFYVAPDVTLERIQHQADGRPMITTEEARMHTLAQAAVATNYGVLCGCPVYMFNTDVDQSSLVASLAERLAK